jgi:hypothetical protein
LSEEQDLALERYLDAIDAIGFGVHRALVEQQASALLMESYTGINEGPPQIGKQWARRWLLRHPKYKRVKAKPMEVQRKLAQEPEALKGWFDRLQSIKEELGILPEDVYNMDETGCRIGVATSQYVYSKNGREVFIPNANNRELVTLVECICASGHAIPPMVIIKAATIMEHWVVDLPDDVLISVSDSGYSNDSLALEWIKHFDKMTKKRTVGRWRLLLVDGHGSHETKEFAKYAEDNCIILFALPPHTTHLLQPLDVGCFQPLKWYHGRCLDWAARTGSQDISKADFMATVAEIRRLTFTRNTILSGWRRTGLSPFNPVVVLGQLKRQEDCNSSAEERSPTPPPAIVQRAGTPTVISSPPQLGSSPTKAPIRSFHRVKIDLEMAQLVRRPPARDATPEPENPEPSDTAFHTPKTVRQIQLQAPFVHAALRQHLPRDMAAGVIRHLRGVSALARIAEGLQRELRSTKAAELAKDERRRRKKRALEVKGGPIYSQDARRMVRQREVNDVARLEAEIAVKRLREVTKIVNKWKRLLPTVRNWGNKYCKRRAEGVSFQRAVARWQYAADDDDYNTTAAEKLLYIKQDRSFKYHEGRITTEQTPAIEVAFGMRRLVDPYTKAVTGWQDERAALAATASQDSTYASQTDPDGATRILHQEQSIDVQVEPIVALGVGEMDNLESISSDNDSYSTSEDEL